MGLGFIAGVLRQRAALRRHERWGRAALASYQAAELDRLRRWAIERSPFYRAVPRGLRIAAAGGPARSEQDTAGIGLILGLVE
jgi:hypothetical protein